MPHLKESYAEKETIMRDKQFFLSRRIGFDEVRRMERNRRGRDGGVLAAAAELFDLPADIVAGLPRLEMVGSRQLYLEHHAGLLAYTEEQIDANTTAGVLRVRGERLTLLAMTAGELRVGGKIVSVEWVESC